MEPVPPGHIRITWATTLTEDYTLTVPLSVLTSEDIDPASITAGGIEARSALDAWLADREDTEDGADAEYQNVQDREITSVDWPPGEEPDQPDTRVHHLADAIQQHTGTGYDRAAAIAARLWDDTADARNP